MSTLNSKLVEDFTADEQYLVGQAADAGPDGTYKKITVITEIYIARMHRESAQLALEASKEIAKASEAQARSLTLATWVLAVATIVLAFATIALFLTA